MLVYFEVVEEPNRAQRLFVATAAVLYTFFRKHFGVKIKSFQKKFGAVKAIIEAQDFQSMANNCLGKNPSGWHKSCQ